MSEQLRQGHAVAVVTEAKEAAEASRTRAQAEVQHLHTRISQLSAQLKVGPCCSAPCQRCISSSVQLLAAKCAVSHVSGRHCQALQAVAAPPALTTLSVQELVDECAQLRSRCNSSEATVDALRQAQTDAADSQRAGMLECRALL